MSRATPLSPDERRRAIIEATLPLLIANGPDLSTKEIAQAAGIAEGTIFRAFETKAELVHAALEEALKPSQAIAAMVALPADQTLEARLAAVIQVVSDEIHRTRSLLVTVFGSLRPKPPHPPPPDARGHSERFELFRRALAEALEPYSDQLTVSVNRAVELVTAVSVAGQMFGAVHHLNDPAEWAEIIAHGIAKGKQ